MSNTVYALNLLLIKFLAIGGERGIRTLDTLSRILPFQGSAFNRSATSPLFNRSIIHTFIYYKKPPIRWSFYKVICMPYFPISLNILIRSLAGGWVENRVLSFCPIVCFSSGPKGLEINRWAVACEAVRIGCL